MESTTEKYTAWIIVLAITLWMAYTYWWGYPFFAHLNIKYEYVTMVLLKFKEFFVSPITLKCFMFFVLCVSFLAMKGRKDENMTKTKIAIWGFLGLLLFFGSIPIAYVRPYTMNVAIIYSFLTSAGFFMIMAAGIWLSRLLKNSVEKDPFNEENESFMQEIVKQENSVSINLSTKFYYAKKLWNGWINVVNPFRATYVIGTPGSGKSYAVINNFIKQEIEKGFAMYIYDYKFPALSVIAYNHLLNVLNKGYSTCDVTFKSGKREIIEYGYKVQPKFYAINFDDPRISNRCNPMHPKFMTDITDANETATTIMFGLNKEWIKHRDFFANSAILYTSILIWFLRIYQDGKYCTFPHLLELISKNVKDLFPILASYMELENLIAPFNDAYQDGALEQLQGQIASARIPLLKMISPQLYWTMTGDDFTLDLNNPEEPKILCVGNNPDRQEIYGAVLSLYNSRIIKIINREHQLRCGVIIDELPTIYFRGLENLIATARSNKVSVCLGFQDYSQLIRDYGREQADAIINTIGNYFAGMVTGHTAETLSKQFGRKWQKHNNLSINKNDVSTSINYQQDQLIPASKIATLSQGKFVGSVADDFGQEIEQKFFHANIVVDSKKVSADEAKYIKLKAKSGTFNTMLSIEKKYKDCLILKDFREKIVNEETGEITYGEDMMEEIIKANYRQIKDDITQLMKSEKERLGIVDDDNKKKKKR
jgi:hypothetical protein